jgi:hypothetical protein
MENRDRTRDQGGRQPGTGSGEEGGDRSSDPRRTREQEQNDNNDGRRNPNQPRPDQTPRTA